MIIYSLMIRSFLRRIISFNLLRLCQAAGDVTLFVDEEPVPEKIEFGLPKNLRFTV